MIVRTSGRKATGLFVVVAWADITCEGPCAGDLASYFLGVSSPLDALDDAGDLGEGGCGGLGGERVLVAA